MTKEHLKNLQIQMSLLRIRGNPDPKTIALMETIGTLIDEVNRLRDLCVQAASCVEGRDPAKAEELRARVYAPASNA